ncbi:MAG: hypothetical protein AAB113_01210, partial [Candidatus Eisenbacteria bacterium]
APSGAIARCEGCGTAAHAECVAENGGCSVQGCAKQAPGKPREKLSIHVEPRPTPPRRLSRRPPVPRSAPASPPRRSRPTRGAASTAPARKS